MSVDLKPFERTGRYWLGLNIQHLRRRRGLTQEELADASQIRARRLRDIENIVPGNNPELATLEAIAKTLKVPIGSLFDAHPEREVAQV